MCNMAGWQAIHYAAELRDSRCLQALLQQDHHLAQRLTRDGTGPLTVAAALANVEAVNLLLPYLDHDDLFCKNVHGLNAVYYAISSDCTQGTSIAKILITKCDVDVNTHLGCASFYDALPYKVVKNKNASILQSLLKAGLDPAYSHNDIGKFSDSSYTSYSATSLPTSLMAYCVVEGWLEGMQLTKNLHKEYQSNNCVSDKFWELFTTVINNSSALQIICEKGDTKVLAWMVENGFRFQYVENVWEEGTWFFFGRARVLSSLPTLSYALRGSIWSKQEFIKYLMSMKSCAAFLQSYQQAVSKYQKQTEEVDAARISLIQTSHPVCAAADAILECISEHAIGDSVQMLLDSSFTFNINRLVLSNQNLTHHDPIGILLNKCLQNVQTFDIIIELLERTSSLQLTAETVIEACHILRIPRVADILISPHLDILKFLSRRSLEEQQQVYQQLCVTHNSVRLAEARNSPTTCSHTINNWLICIQLLLKGYKTSLKCCCCIRRCHGPCFLPITWVFATDQERENLVNLMDDENNGDLVTAEWKQGRVSSLQALSRAAVRKQIGFSRLLTEPVPRALTSMMDVVADSSWEISVIDQLPIAWFLKDFLRFRPELQQFYSSIQN
ncbi:uncharacterized protein [Watersipora subatra]